MKNYDNVIRSTKHHPFFVDKKHRQSTQNDLQMLCTETKYSLSISSAGHQFGLQIKKCN